jgi:hypothetical protein
VGILSKAGVPVTKTVKDYQKQNDLLYRREQYDWFRSVAMGAATKKIDQKMLSSKHKVNKRVFVGINKN